MTDLPTRLAQALEFDGPKSRNVSQQYAIEEDGDNVSVDDHFRGMFEENYRLAPLHRALVEAVSAAKQTLWINECRCNEAYTCRGMHEPNALCGEMDELVQALASLDTAIKESGK